MATTINSNTFKGSNQGNSEGYIPQTTIESGKMDADMGQIKYDLDYHLSLLQRAYEKLDLIDPETLSTMTADQIVSIINASNKKIDADNLEDKVIILQELVDALQVHCNTIVPGEMHYEHSIKPTGLSYSSTPSTVLTVCNNLLDELKNLRYQINRLNGKSTWIDTPDSNITELKSLITSDNNALNAHKADSTVHITATQDAALNGANNPSGSNPFATINDVGSFGYGDMKKSVYDKNNNGIVDSSCALADACNANQLKTYQDIVTKIATDIATHRSNASAHHTRYTDAEAIGAINNDTDHDITAKHYYPHLLNKPPADAFLTTEVTNIRANKLANGTTPWDSTVNLVDGLIPADLLPNLMVMPTTWSNESNHILTKSYFSTCQSTTVESSLAGPAVLIGGMAVKSESNSILQISVNGGSTWVDLYVSPVMLFGPDPQGDEIRYWSCPAMYIPSGRTFRIRAGSTFTGCSDKVYGAGYHIQYRSL